MAPTELPSFYLYSTGYSPELLTLGTLVYGNYGTPETRSVTFPKLSDQESEELEAQSEIISQSVSGCFTYTKKSKYGLGIGFAEVADLDLEYARQCKKLVEAKEGKRVILRNPDTFFERVLKDQKILDKLTLWLTAAKSSWLFYRATFQKPRVFCLTGYYKLSKVKAKIDCEHTYSAILGVSPAVVGAVSGVPIGGRIGPFSNGQTLEANVSMAAPGIWAGRFHELKVEYIQMATDGKTELPSTIMLRDDCTHPRGGLMGGEPAICETRVVLEPEEIKYAQGVKTTLAEAEEIEDEAEPNREYWKAFEKAEGRLQDDGEDVDDDEDDSEDEDGGEK